MTIIAPYRRKDAAVHRWFIAGHDRAWPKAELRFRFGRCFSSIDSLPRHPNSTRMCRSPIALRGIPCTSPRAASPAALKSP